MFVGASLFRLVLVCVMSSEKKKATTVPVDLEGAGKKHKEETSEVPKGHRKSGRSWKELQGKKQRISSLTTLPHMRRSVAERRMQEREFKDMQKLEREMKERDSKEKEEVRLRTEENRRRREANEKKNEVVEIITNTRKLKRLSKRQMRNIRPLMDTSSLEKKA